MTSQDHISSDQPTDKEGWRAWARRRRTASIPDHAAHCRVLADFLDNLLADTGQVRPDGYVVVYDALGDEVDLTALTATERQPGSRFAITRTPDSGHVLTIHPLGGPTELHRYGYRQPTADAPTVSDDDVAAVLCPGLVFDRQGNRLGRGAGYYDRFLARLPAGVAKVGVTADLVVDHLPSDPHDVAMTHLATSTGVEAVNPAP